MSDLNHESNEEKWTGAHKYDFIKKYAFLLFWLVLAVVVAVYIIFNGGSIIAAISGFFSALQPIIFGIIFAYLLNPSVKFYEKHIFAPLTAKMKNQDRAKGLNRGLAITLSVLIFLAIIVVLLNMIIPELYNSILYLITYVPGQLTKVTDWFHNYLSSGDNLSQLIQMGIDNFSTHFQTWLQTELLSTVNTTVSSVTVGVIEVVKTFFNLFIGIIVSIYVLASKESFIGQVKKTFFSLLKTEKANLILKTMRKSNEIFIGFVCGKIMESAIIGVLCFIGSSILQMPYAMLVSVIVGVTFLVPFFGPYLGAIPSILLIALADPFKGITFAIFIIVLQQVQCNLISPKILGDSTGLSPFWVVFSILAGGALFGFIGLLMGVPTFAVIYYIIGQVINHRLRKKDLPTTSESYVDIEFIDTETGDFDYYTDEEKAANSVFNKMFKKNKKSEKKDDKS
ncbi:MAG: AI-2E family transporter [Lachnospiraceae bacterium]|nr:AI-2E family transporter [Lachnospiraceae bacterium]